ncbi:uncharacterized protein AMSG_04517 [Thecamonas trahens ATCC 50062]|uniref:ADF-H domain-containing protein n=1 Tax=Thecamonas trahens ATCC 50062 TaxID=461836 RepID=A0A0L0D7C3_THETB|nr:hypothetical protein AMSG_04517 [Thecamonas trahens ATCC 50062]KNC48287.1 hypothetical protein AMSG_04517 [Thecamonas trahens ATCC 50062]|eukprot:XP_013758854.1 hypothetical protein AMSG_04517 [Thecamonas trahens ATCC 50062]
MAQLEATDDAIEAFNSLRRAGGGAFVTLVLGESITLGETHLPGPDGQTMAYEEFVNSLRDDTPRFIFYNFAFETTTGGSRLKVLLIKWVPGRTTRVDKMRYSMWSSSVKAAFKGAHCTVQANGVDDLDYLTVLERAAKFERDPVVGLA